MKSQLNDMLEIWCALSNDIARSYATSSVELSRDCETAKHNTISRGIGFFTLDLPSLDAHLLQLLEDGYVRFEGPLTARRSKKDVRPRFLWFLWSRICDVNGWLLDEPDPDAIFFLRQITSIFKKLEVGCADWRLQETLTGYHQNDSRIVPPILDWSGDTLEVDDRIRFDRSFHRSETPLLDAGQSVDDLQVYRFLQRLDRVAAVLITELGTFDAMSESSPEMGIFSHGKGAVSNLRGSEYKYSFPTWSEKLEGTFPFDWCSGASIGSVPRSNVEPFSKLCAVPKTSKSPRLIASEPVEHQWCQQKIMTWLDYRIDTSIAGCFLNLHDQGLSRDLVRTSSLDRSLSTIDLSNASDLLSCRHIESMLRSNPGLLCAVHAVRTRVLRDPYSNSLIKLKKFASQGSALTFPLESLFFLSVALASAGASTPKEIRKLIGKVRVYGDDIIVPSAAYEATVYNLTYLGLQVSVKKSFTKGKFRESCGMDCWNGFDVTPAKPKHLSSDTPVQVMSMLELANNLYLKGLWLASDKVKSLLPKRFSKVVMNYKSGVLALWSYGKSLIPPMIKWCKRLHYHYFDVPSVTTKSKRKALDSSDSLREHLTRRFSALQPRILGVANRPREIFSVVRVSL